MILHIPADAPWLVKDAAVAVLVLHIGGGLVGIGSGAAAMSSPKGSTPHRWAGHAFLVSMLIMAGIGAAVSPLLPQWGNVGPAVWTCYLVATGWLAAHKPEAVVGRLGRVALGVVAVLALIEIATGVYAVGHPLAFKGTPTAAFFIAGALALVTAAADIRVIRIGGVRGPQRIARHVWRLSSALFFAEASFFLGQPRVFPPGFRDTPIMFAPEIATLAYMIYWLVKLGRRGARRRAAGGHEAARAPRHAGVEAAAASVRQLR